VYLGSLIHSSTRSTPDIIRRSAITHAATQSLDNHFWKSRISIPTKLKLYDTCILPIFLYGSECWAITKVDPRRIDALDQWYLRTLLGIKWHQFVCNEEVRRKTKQPNLTAIIHSQRLSIFGHIARMDDDAVAKMILTAPLPENWKRPPGRPRITWLNTIQRRESLQPHTERSIRSGSEPPSVEADVYVWRYALLVVHAKKKKKDVNEARDDEVAVASAGPYAYHLHLAPDR